MTRGFITIATGDEKYYEMAVNLLHSYRYFSGITLPFAIFADRENELTAKFDDVRLLSPAHRNYLDKLQMYNYLPYDENIFIDADCLAYGDLNELFDIFKEADDFSCFGRVLPTDDKTGWFEYENLGELKERVSYVVGLHGGIYYMRRTEVSRAVLETAQNLVPHYSEYGFKGNFATPGDEPLVALSMAIHNCHPIAHDQRAILCYWEHNGAMKLNLPKRKALASDIGISTNLLHWGTRFTTTPLYRKQVADLNVMMNGKGKFALVVNGFRYGAENAALSAINFANRCLNKLMRILHLK